MCGRWLFCKIIERFLPVPDCVHAEVKFLNCFQRDLLVNVTTCKWLVNASSQLFFFFSKTYLSSTTNI